MPFFLNQFLLQISERVPPLACLCVHSAAVQPSVNGRRVVKVSLILGHLVMISFPSPHWPCIAFVPSDVFFPDTSFSKMSPQVKLLYTAKLSHLSLCTEDHLA